MVIHTNWSDNIIIWDKYFSRRYKTLIAYVLDGICDWLRVQSLMLGWEQKSYNSLKCLTSKNEEMQNVCDEKLICLLNVEMNYKQQIYQLDGSKYLIFSVHCLWNESLCVYIRLMIGSWLIGISDEGLCGNVRYIYDPKYKAALNHMKYRLRSISFHSLFMNLSFIISFLLSKLMWRSKQIETSLSHNTFNEALPAPTNPSVQAG